MSVKTFFIVIADDDLDDQYIIEQALQETNIKFNLVLFSNGLELMNFLGRKENEDGTEAVKPDLVLMDLNMPLLDGYGALQQIKTSDGLRNIPVYVLSTSRFDYDKEKSLQMGATGFYSKPYQFDELKLVIKEICKKVFLSFEPKQ
jgi:CheY-like chemotaxis protein